MEKILVIGCSGQIGSELTLALRKLYGNENVYATDIKQAPADILETGPFHILDVLDYNTCCILQYVIISRRCIIWLRYYPAMPKEFRNKPGKSI